MIQIDYAKGYPRMRAKLPRQMLAKYQEIMFKMGFYPQAGQVRGFGGTGARPSDALDIQSELDREYREKMAVHLGVKPEELRKFIADNPGVARLGTGARPSRYDPQPLGFLGKHFVKRQGWQRALDIQEVMSRWSEYVGSEIGAHTKIESFEAGKLTIRCDSTAWATQLKWLIPQIEKRLAERLGSDTVKQVIIRGPVVPSWKHGRLSVPGRGPRDTYG